MAPTINDFTLPLPTTGAALNSALITLCMFTHMGVREIFESSVVYIQSKWGSPLIAAVTTTSVFCVCSCTELTLPINQRWSGREVHFMKIHAQRTWTRIWIKVLESFSCTVVCEQAFQIQLFYSSSEFNCVPAPSKKVWNGSLQRWNGLMEYMNYKPLCVCLLSGCHQRLIV